LNEKHNRSDQLTNDKRRHCLLRLLADWHNRQARYLLLTVLAGQHDQGRFHLWSQQGFRGLPMKQR
jgi:hypothetical protein